MSSKAPPVPPANRTDKGPRDENARLGQQNGSKVPENPDKQGQTGNVKENTTNQGYQQDR
ncbi:hypothetical protein [Rhodoligotrophos defluvii]|uniref:hypothetical protein n=1 Tax=Rhodoligotrophos defluvii TaxID=2561934 RepID=UPI0010CA0F6D|nr:hypothetical protein [Rhodoligotrophos defluvii]